MDPRQFERFVDHWTPERCRHEPLQQKLMRALLNATSCVETYREILAGKDPIAPVSLFPAQTYPEGGTGL